MEDFITLTMLFLVAAAFLAGFVDSIAGGGGLITIPALLLTGMAPVEALGTNKLQGLFGAGSAAIAYARKGHVNPLQQWPMALVAFAAAIAGGWAATHVPPHWFRAVLPFLLIAIALYFAFKPNLNDIDRHARLGAVAFTLAAVAPVAFYDGIFGPGAGSFYMIAFVALAGHGVLKATAHTKFLNFSSNLGGFAAFAAAGVIDWRTGLAMGLFQFAGARLGAGFAMVKGAKLIKPLLVVTCCALALRLWFTA